MTNGRVELEPGILLLVPSSSNPGETHEIRLSKHGTIYCDCEGFRWRGMCSHVAQLVVSNPSMKSIVRYSLMERARMAEAALAELDD